MEKSNLVENLCGREMNSPEGAGFDLRLGEIYGLSGEGFLGIEERDTPEIELIAKYSGDENEKDNFFVFEPGQYYLVKTVEKINLPLDLSAVIFSRGTLFRSGLALFNGIVHGGYSGELTFGLVNLGQAKVKISLGARIAHIVFEMVSGEASQYRGQWQGGRVSTNGKETQI